MDMESIIPMMLLLMVVVGIGLVLVSVFKMQEQDDIVSIENTPLETTIDALKTSLGEVDQAMSELDQMSKTIFQELDQKYQEILYLYSFIDEKKTEVLQLYNKPIVKEETRISDVVEKKGSCLPKVLEEVQESSYNPKNHQILQLHQSGLSVNQIAKQLHVGQGEVQFVIELSKERCI